MGHTSFEMSLCSLDYCKTMHVYSDILHINVPECRIHILQLSCVHFKEEEDEKEEEEEEDEEKTETKSR